MGYRVHTLSPGRRHARPGRWPTSRFAADYDDLDAIRAFARGVDVVTFEFENVSTAAADAAAEFAPVRPSGSALHITQQRAREKAFLADRGFPVAPFARVQSLDELAVALGTVGLPAIVKTAAFGYDGKGQHRIESHRATAERGVGADRPPGSDRRARDRLHAARSRSSPRAGSTARWSHYGAIENRHVNHILDLSIAPGARARRRSRPRPAR